MASVEVRFYHSLREVAGTPAERYHVDEGATVGDLLAAVFARHRGMAPMRQSMLLARNGVFADTTQPVHHGDTVDLMPPVSGG